MAIERPDGATLAPWKSGCLLVWDATCPDTLAPSYTLFFTQEPRKVAVNAEERKIEIYRDLPPGHIIVTHSHWPNVTDLPERVEASHRMQLRPVSPSLQNTCSSCSQWRSSGGTVPQCLAARAPDFSFLQNFIFVIDMLGDNYFALPKQNSNEHKKSYENA